MTIPAYDQSERERLQEMEILRLRAELGDVRAQVANLRRLYENAQRLIDRYNMRNNPKAAAEA